MRSPIPDYFGVAVSYFRKMFPVAGGRFYDVARVYHDEGVLPYLLRTMPQYHPLDTLLTKVPPFSGASFDKSLFSLTATSQRLELLGEVLL